MTREEAIKIMQNMKNHAERTDDKELMDACDTAIKVLEQQPCEDAVSRQAVHDLIAELLSDYLHDEDREKIEKLDVKIEDLEPVTPVEKVGRWIDADGDNAICGCCNRLNHLYGDYCKHCGAKMIEQQESEE